MRHAFPCGAELRGKADEVTGLLPLGCVASGSAGWASARARLGALWLLMDGVTEVDGARRPFCGHGHLALPRQRLCTCRVSTNLAAVVVTFSQCGGPSFHPGHGLLGLHFRLTSVGLSHRCGGVLSAGV